MVPASLAFLDWTQLSQGHLLPLEILGDQETLLAQGGPSCLHSPPQVDRKGRGDRVVQQTLSLHSDQAAPDPLEGL